MRMPSGLPVLGLALAWAAAPLSAQTAYGTILGTVTDPSAAAIPSASVTVTNVGTNISNEVATSGEGGYAVARLIPGQYQIEVSFQGFKTAVSPVLTLLVNQSLRFDATLEPGAVETVVEVTASGTLIETDTSSVGKVVENKQIVDLPMVSRNFTDLIVLSPATVTDNGGALNNEQNSFRTRLSGGGSFIGGGRGADNTYMIDGVENNDPGFQTPSITPPIDAIQEFRLMNKNYSAEFGGGAAQINIAIKSGTNEIHGTAYEFFRNDVLNARNFFAEADPITGRSKPQLRYNQFGGSVGGPVARNRLFYFFNYEGTRVRTFSPQTGRYPTRAQLNGDFSGDLPITDHATGNIFPNNTVPSDRLNSKAKELLFLFPEPNVPTQAGFNTVKTLSAPENVDQYHGRTDWLATQKDNLFIRASISDQDILRPALRPLGGALDQQKGRNLALAWTRVFSPQWLNEVRLGFSRPISLRAQEGAFAEDVAGSLFRGTDTAPVTFGAPAISLADYGGIGSTGNGPLNYLTNSWSFVDAVSYTSGQHKIKAGIDFRDFLFKEVNAFRPRGAVSFTGLFTQNPANATGNSVADFVLGLPFSAAVNQGEFTSWFHAQVYNLYVQDDWTISPRLTINWGLRYEYRTPLEEELDRVSIFDPEHPGGRMKTPNQAIVEALDTPLIAGGASRGLIDPDRNNLAPRIGLAYRPFGDNRTVVRTGYGVFYTTFEFNEYIFSVLNAPWQKTSAVNASLENPIDFGNLFPTADTPVPIAGSMSSLSLDPTNRTPYVQQWNFNVQRELGQNWVLELGYLGSKSTKLATRSVISQGMLVRPGPDPEVVFPYSNFAFILIDRTEGLSNYHAGFVRLEKRFRKGYYLSAHHTWSKGLSLASSACSVGNDACLGRQNAWNLRADYGPNSYDITHRFVFSGIWELPFGRGRLFGSRMNPVADRILGGWQLNAIYQIQSGFPFSVGARDVSGTRSSFFPRADLVGDPHAADREDSARVFNRFAFEQPGEGTFGNSGRNILRGEGLNNIDFSLFKNADITERLRIQIRAEFFNLLNHTQFGPFPGSSFSLDPNSQFGVYRSIQQEARIVQLGLKFIF